MSKVLWRPRSEPAQEVNSKGPSRMIGNIERCQRKDDLEDAARAEKAEAN